MAKNRKNQSAAVRFGPALKAFVLCVIIGGAGVGYVWQKSQITELGRQITQREQRLKELGIQNQKLRDHLAEQCSPEQLNERVQKLNLGLGMPQPSQVSALPEPVLNAPASVNAPARPVAGASATGLAMQ
jgi:uncharacterized protein HemX